MGGDKESKVLPKVVLMGSDAITVPLLDFLHASDKVELLGVISQPDKPHGRGKKLLPNALAGRAQELGVHVRKPGKPGKAEVDWLLEQEVTLSIVMAYGHLLKDDLLEAPVHGTVNLHTSALPKYRGASPVPGALAEGEVDIGVSLMRVVREMDAGPVASIEWIRARPEDNTLTVEGHLAEAAVKLVQRNLDSLLGGELTFQEQDHEEATYTRKLNKEDGWLDFEQSALTLWHRVRAVTPWPGGFFEYEGQRIKIGEAVVGNGSGEPGEISFATKEGVGIATPDGILVCRQLQRPGGKMLPAADFLNGFRLEPGQRVTGGEMEPIVRKNP